MALRELTKEYLTKAVYHTPLEIVRLMAEALPIGEGTVLDICGGSEDFLLRAAAMKQKKSEEELLIFENWTGTEDTSDGRENLLICGPTDKAADHLKKKKGKKSEEKTFDAVLMNPPFGYTKGEKKGRVRLESQFLTQAADCVAENGHCAAVVPGGLLNRTAVEDVELRKRFVEKFHVEQVILLPISAFLPYAEVRTGIFIFAKEKGDGMTRFYDLRKVEPENRKLLPEIYQRSEPVCVLNRTTLSEHQYILSTEEYLGAEKADERALISRERILRRQLSRLSEKLPSVYENELGQIGMFPCQKGIQTRKAVIKEILECEYGLLECALLKAAGKEKWPEKEGNTFLKIWSGQRLDEEEKDGPYRVYGAAGVQGSARTATMKEEQAILIGRVGSYCGAVYKAWTKGFVSDNVMLAGAVEEEAEEAMEEIGVTYLRDKLCTEMSGGELQMVLIARALTISPSMLVLDEPESNLDFKNQLIILETIQKLSKNRGISAIVNTHYPEHALKISDKALLLNQDGTNIFGDAAEVINVENMRHSFSVQVHINQFSVDGREYRSVVPLHLV